MGVEIWERNSSVAEPTILNAGQVVPVYGTVRVILGLNRTCHQTSRLKEGLVTGSLNIYDEKLVLTDVAITLFATISTIKYLGRKVNGGTNYGRQLRTCRDDVARLKAP